MFRVMRERRKRREREEALYLSCPLLFAKKNA